MAKKANGATTIAQRVQGFGRSKDHGHQTFLADPLQKQTSHSVNKKFDSEVKKQGFDK